MLLDVVNIYKQLVLEEISVACVHEEYSRTLEIARGAPLSPPPRHGNRSYEYVLRLLRAAAYETGGATFKIAMLIVPQLHIWLRTMNFLSFYFYW